MKNLIIGLIVVLLLPVSVSCAPPTPIPAPAPAPAPTPAPAPEEEKELTVEAWEIGDNWTYSPQAIWEDVMVGLESEQERGKIVKQYIAAYNLRSRGKELVYELSPDRMPGQAPAIHGSNVVWSSAGDVFLLDLGTGEVQQITNDNHAQV
ncbi:MAG TPA: hypothetical protein VMW00_04515, partial [Dehalococcoidales bacterium]|nr:hypothetical protein [Dehalococcoidales bacterium]